MIRLLLSLALLLAFVLSPMVHASDAFEPVSLECKDMKEAQESLDDVIKKYPSTITIRTRRAMSKSAIRKLCESLMETGYTNQYQYIMDNGAVTITPEYNDWAYMRGVTLGVLEEAVLKGKVKKAYNQLLEIAEDVKSEASAMELPAGVSQEYMLALALHDYVCRHTVYKLSYKNKATEAVTHMVLKGQGVCEGYTRLYSILLTVCGVENHYISGKGKGQSHAWNMVKLNGEWVHVDVTWDDPGKQKDSEPLHLYFGMSDEMISQDHKWNQKRTPSAVTDQLLYSKVMK